MWAGAGAGEVSLQERRPRLSRPGSRSVHREEERDPGPRGQWGLPGGLATPSSLADPITHKLCFRRPDRERRASTAPFHLDEVPRTGNSIATGSRIEVTMGWGRGRRELVLKEQGVYVEEDEKCGCGWR